MSRTLFVTACGCALLAAWWLGQASADEAEAVKLRPKTSMALVDVSRIFLESPRLKRLHAEIKSDYEEAIASKTERKEIDGDFKLREGAMYRSIHRDVKVAIEQYADEHGIDLVIRWQPSREPVAEIDDEDDVNRVMAQINELVPYERDLDITDAVIERMRASGSL